MLPNFRAKAPAFSHLSNRGLKSAVMKQHVHSALALTESQLIKNILLKTLFISENGIISIG